MSLMNKMRNKGFWLLDTLKGRPLQKDLNDIKDSFKITSFSKLQEKNAPILKNLLDTTVNSSEFYHKYKSYDTLTDFPVVNKLIIKEHLDTINIIPKTSPSLIRVSSSGSTGTPFEIYQTKRKSIRNKADVMFFANSAGYTVGDQLLFTRLWLSKYRKPVLFKKLLNLVEIDVEADLNDKHIGRLMAKISMDRQPKGFIGYPSGFDKICRYLDKIDASPLDCNIKSIIATSESLYDYTREKMEYYFKSPIVSRYSNEENGILSQQMINEKEYTINWASFFVEILDIHRDEPVKMGELGRIVVTDLYNLATPMIRYDTGDLGKFCITGNDSIPKFEMVSGRRTDVLYNTKGEIVNPFVIYAGITKFPEVNQFQIVQKGAKEYIFKLNIDSPLTRENELMSYYKSYLGDDATITKEYVNEIPLASSGKRRVILNQYKP